MSKRAEEIALKKYPVDICGYTVECRVGAKPQPQDWNEIRRTHFQEGYEQAENDLGWISVKDKLPEVGHFVLTCVSDSGTPQCVGMAILLNDGTWWDGDMKVCVDYWMEVPKFNEVKK